jgi:hypothetical protein
MSFDDHVLCHRMLITPWALTTFGAATAEAVAAAAAAVKNCAGSRGRTSIVST